MTATQIFNLDGKVALVTGASSGLGARFAEVLAANGAAVVLVARRAERLTGLQAQIEKAGGKAVTVAVDVRDRHAMTGAFDAAEKAFGTVTILVNNAGVAHAARAVELAEDEWRRVLSIDLDAVFFWAQEAARRMLAAKSGGSIVNIASVLGFGVDKGVIAYATAKAGVIQLTKALALELAIKRDIPVGRFGEERDLDGPLLLLASDAGSFVTGATIVADGGQMIALRG